MLSDKPNPPPTLLALSLDDPAAAMRDPALTALLNQGWTVAADTVGESAARGRPEWVLMLVPPAPIGDPATLPRSQRVALGVLLVVLSGAGIVSTVLLALILNAIGA